MTTGEKRTAQRRIAIIGGGISGLGAAWALHHDPDQFYFRLFEAQAQIGGNAITADMPQDDGSSIPFGMSVTACIPSMYHHIVLLMKSFDIALIDTTFNYSVKYRGQVYTHDFDSEIRAQLRSELAQFQRILRRLRWFGQLTRSSITGVSCTARVSAEPRPHWSLHRDGGHGVEVGDPVRLAGRAVLQSDRPRNR